LDAMTIFEQSVIIISLALASYWVFSKLRLPSPSFIGPMVAIGIFQIFGGGLQAIPLRAVNIFQIIIGLSVGASINHQKIRELKKIALPSIVVAVFTLVTTAIFTLLIRNFTTDYPTALFSAAPGGITEMGVIALSYHAEMAIVSTFQFSRLVIVISIIPLISKFVKNNARGETIPEKITQEDIISPEDISQENVLQNGKKVQTRHFPYNRKQILMFVAGATGGLILVSFRLPGGGVIGSMFIFGILNVVFRENILFPRHISTFARLGVGSTIGLEFSPQMVQKVGEMLLPIIAFSILIVFGNLLVGWVIRYITKWDTTTCLLSTSPGGISQMLAVGEEMNADTLMISILQMVRMVTIIGCVPIIAAIII
jgi:membrane AbrB-like protein